MTLPGTSVSISDVAPSRFAAESTAAWFVEGFTDRGPTDAPVPIRSLAEYVANFGAFVSYGQLYDALDAYFHEGGGIAYVTRVAGPAAAKATHAVLDVSNATCLTANAKSVGAWGNNLSVAVTAGDTSGTVILTISESGNVVEVSPELATTADAIAWASASSRYIDLVQGGSTNDPKVQTVALAGGGDDRTNAIDSVWATALELATNDYGPGQVSAPGKTTSTIHDALLDHAYAHNRIAILDDTDTEDAGDLISDAAALRARYSSRAGALFAPWAIIPGSTPGTTRTVPYSAIQAGLIARSEAEGNNPNVPAAGENGAAIYAVGLSQVAWSDSDREALNEGGVNVARIIRSEVRTYGYRTLADPLSDDVWVGLGGARVAMAIAAASEEIAERFLFAQLDGRGLKVAEFGGELSALCANYYDAGALFGETPDDAFVIDVGPGVNTPSNIAAGKLSAALELKTSPFAERVEVTITKTRSDASL